MTRPDLAPKIAEALADYALTSSTSDLAALTPGHGAKVWADMAERFPEATWDELACGTLIALELLAARSGGIEADTQKLRALKARRREP